MRWLVLALLAVAGLPLSGCTEPPRHWSPNDEVVGFRASYTTTQETANGTLTGTLRFVLDGPFQIADRDLSVHQALRLGMVWDRQLHSNQPGLTDLNGGLETLQPISRDYYLDGAWRIVRVAYPEVEGGNGLLRMVSWTLQGVPAPLGIGRALLRDGLPEYLVDGRPVAATLREDNGWQGLDGFDVLPLDPLVAFGERVRYHSPRDLLPDRFELPEHREGTVIEGRLEGVWRLDPLPAVDVWPLDPFMDPMAARSSWRVLHGESEDVFGMGATLDFLLDEFVRLEPRGQELLDHGCMTQASLSPDGGSRGMAGVNLPGLSIAILPYAAMTFELDFPENGRTTSYRIHYRSSDGVQPEEVTVERVQYPFFSNVCLERGHAAPRTLLEAMREAWQIPTPDSGVPCGAIHLPRQVLSESGPDVQGSTDLFFLRFTVEENSPHDASPSLGWMMWNEEGATWDAMVLHHRDLARLDQGDAPPRPLPGPGPLRPGQASAHCMAPPPDELLQPPLLGFR